MYSVARIMVAELVNDKENYCLGNFLNGNFGVK